MEHDRSPKGPRVRRFPALSQLLTLTYTSPTLCRTDNIVRSAKGNYSMLVPRRINDEPLSMLSRRSLRRWNPDFGPLGIVRGSHDYVGCGNCKRANQARITSRVFLKLKHAPLNS